MNILKFIGNISYSLYLWHWPVIIFYKLETTHDYPSMFEQITLLFVSIILGYLSWQFIEKSVKHYTFNRNSFKPIILSVSASALISSTAILAMDGLPDRYTDKQIKYSSYLKYEPKGFREGKCFLSSKYNNFDLFNQNECVTYDPNMKNTLLIGDSHAAHWYNALNKLKSDTETITQVTSSGCKPTNSYTGVKRCTDLVKWAFHDLIKNKHFDRIILSAQWYKSDLPGVLDTIKELQNHTDKIVILGPIVEYERALPKLLAEYQLEEKIRPFRKYSLIKSYDDYFYNALKNSVANYISVLNVICPDKNKCIMTTNDDTPMQFDYGHLTHKGAITLLNKISKSAQF